MRTIAKTLLIVATMASAAAAQAGHYDSKTIRYSTKQLDSLDGRAAVYRELKLAVQAVCGPTNLRKAGSVYQKRINADCTKTRLDEMIEKIGHRELTALHRQTDIVVGD